MGIDNNEEGGKRARAPKHPIKHEERKESRRRLRGNQDVVTWEAASADALHSLVLRVNERGGLVSFGSTRDRGALYVQVYLDGTPTREYLRPSDDIDTILYEWAAELAPGSEHQQKMKL